MLNYDDLITLDAEDLAECGLLKAYRKLLPSLRRYLQEPADIEEITDDNVPLYTVKCNGSEFRIYAPDLSESGGGSWGRATYALFSIVNNQLKASPYRLYAINCGNDLGAMFLTKTQALGARESLPKRSDWPYLPVNTPPWFGQYH